MWVPLSLAMVFAAQAQATVVVMHSVEEMTRRSDVVVHARVADQRVVREGPRVVTLTDIEVIDGYKGAKPGDVLTVYQVGGDLDGVKAWIAGAHEHKVGEEMVFFAVKHGERVVSYGVGLGKFSVVHDGALTRIVEDLGEVAVMQPTADGQAQFTSPEPRTSASLEAFARDVKAFAARGDMPRSEKAAKRLKKMAPKKLLNDLRVAPKRGR
jgi:hypothetical protein